MENLKQFVLDQLKANSGKLRQIAADAPVPYPTLLKINQGVISNPGVDHMQTLYNYFKKNP
jgi:hypothetical protein